jgi:hypothetical protein
VLCKLHEAATPPSFLAASIINKSAVLLMPPHHKETCRRPAGSPGLRIADGLSQYAAAVNAQCCYPAEGGRASPLVIAANAQCSRVVQASEFFNIEPMRQAASLHFMDLAGRPQFREAASQQLLLHGTSVIPGLMQATRFAMPLKRHLELLPVQDGLDGSELECRNTWRRMCVQTHFPVLNRESKRGSLHLDCRLVALPLALELLEAFAAHASPEDLVLSHFDSAHLYTVAWGPLVAALCKCRSLSLRDCVLVGDIDLMVTIMSCTFVFTSLVLHNVMDDRGLFGSGGLLAGLLHHPGLISITCSGEASHTDLGGVVWRAVCSSVDFGGPAGDGEPSLACREMQVVNIPWAAPGGPNQEDNIMPTIPLSEMGRNWPTLRSLCITVEEELWGDVAKFLASESTSSVLTELRLLAPSPMPGLHMGREVDSVAIVTAIADRFLSYSRLHKLDLTAVPLRRERARSALTEGLLRCATPHPRVEACDPQRTQSSAQELVHLALHMPVEALGTVGNEGTSMVEAIQGLQNLTHLHLRLGGPQYPSGASRLADHERSHTWSKGGGQPPAPETCMALHGAIDGLRCLKRLVLQLAVVDADYGFRGWRRLPTSCGDLDDMYERGEEAEEGLCVLSGELDWPSDCMRAALPMGGRVSELQVWDCWDSLNGLTTIAGSFRSLHSLVVGHSDGLRCGSVVPPGTARMAFRPAPSCFSPLKELTTLRHLAVVSSKMGLGSLCSISCLTGLGLLLLSALEFPPGRFWEEELQAVLCSLSALTKLVIRHCAVQVFPPWAWENNAHVSRGWEGRLSEAPLQALRCFPPALSHRVAPSSELCSSDEQPPPLPLRSHTLPLNRLEVIDLLVRNHAVCRNRLHGHNTRYRVIALQSDFVLCSTTYLLKYRDVA